MVPIDVDGYSGMPPAAKDCPKIRHLQDAGWPFPRYSQYRDGTDSAPRKHFASTCGDENIMPRVLTKVRTGFTLTELMIVVAIVGLLAAIAIPSFAHARKRSLNVRFAADLQVAKAAFIEYAFDHGKYPPDTTPSVVPEGMPDYLRRVAWTEPNTLGGQWDWDNAQFGFKAGVSIYRPTASSEQMLQLDKTIDDGNLFTGDFRSRSDGYIGIIEE
jgi:prepilin-type N-terminal cleavage/methylation domain-containing protein